VRRTQSLPGRVLSTILEEYKRDSLLDYSDDSLSHSKPEVKTKFETKANYNSRASCPNFKSASLPSRAFQSILNSVEEEDDDHPKMTAQFDRRAMFHEFYGAEPSTALDSSQPEAANRSKPAKPEVVPITDDAGSDSDSLEEADLEAKIAHMGHHTMAKPPTKEEEKKHKSFLAKFSVKNLIHKKNDESRRSSYPKRLKSLGRSLGRILPDFSLFT